MPDGLHAATLAGLHGGLFEALVDDTFDEWCARLAGATGATAVCLSRLDDEALVPVGVWGTTSEPAGPQSCPPVRTDTLPLLCRRGAMTPRALSRGECQALSAGAPPAVGLPLVADDAVVGSLVLFGASELGPDARLLVTNVAPVAALAMRMLLRLRASRANVARHEAVLDALELMIIVADRAGLVTGANRALRQRLGATESSLLGRAARAVFPGQELPSPGEHPRTTLTGPHGEPLRASAHALVGGGTVIVIQDSRVGSVPRLPVPVVPTPVARVEARRAKVLVVDDEPSILRAIARTLSPAHEVLLAHDGADAISLIDQTSDLDVVVTDLQMPRLGGGGLYRWIAQQRPELERRVLFITGGVFEAETERFLDGMAGRVLRKPFDPEALRRAVDGRLSV